MRIIFMGTPEFAVPSLRALVEAGHDLCAVYTQPPRPAGRKMALVRSPVHECAESLGILVKTAASLRNEAAQQEFAAFESDVAIVAAYGLILPPPILEAPRFGCVNVHASLLPRWRGAAPVQRAILAGDQDTGVSIMAMEAGLDTGPVYATAQTGIGGKTGLELTSELAVLGAKLLVNSLNKLGNSIPEPQPTLGVTYASKIDKSETHLDFLNSAPQIERQIRAFSPLAWFALGDERIRIVSAEVLAPQDSPPAAPATVIDDQLTIACNPGAIRALVVQRAGKAAMPVADLLRGLSITAGTRLG